MVDRQDRDDEQTVELPVAHVGRRWIAPAGAVAIFVAATGVTLALLTAPAEDATSLAAASGPTTALAPLAPTSSPSAPTVSSSSAAEPAGSACSGPRAFAAAVARVDATYTARRGFDGYEMKGCAQGIALAWGVEGEQDATWVALFPTGRGGYDLDEWGTGEPCPAGRRLPAALAEQACADYVPATTTGVTTSAQSATPPTPPTTAAPATP